MIKNGVPFCDYCHNELVALTREECLNDIRGHGWINWRDAQVHCCYNCSEKLWQPPCEICETHPCEKGQDCWSTPPQHLFPYETYYADVLGKTYDLIDEDFDLEEPIDIEVRQRQIMRQAGNHPNQRKLFV